MHKRMIKLNHTIYKIIYLEYLRIKIIIVLFYKQLIIDHIKNLEQFI